MRGFNRVALRRSPRLDRLPSRPGGGQHRGHRASSPGSRCRVSLGSPEEIGDSPKGGLGACPASAVAASVWGTDPVFSRYGVPEIALVCERRSLWVLPRTLSVASSLRKEPSIRSGVTSLPETTKRGVKRRLETLRSLTRCTVVTPRNPCGPGRDLCDPDLRLIYIWPTPMKIHKAFC